MGKWKYWRHPKIQSWDLMTDDAPIGMVSVEKLDGMTGYDVVAAINPDNLDNYGALEEAKSAALAKDLYI